MIIQNIYLPTLSIIFFAAFILASIIHLTFCFLEKEKARKISKPFCMFFLAAFVGVWKPDYYLVWLGVTFGFIGDLLLIWKKRRAFLVVGGAAFAVGHFLYLFQIADLYARIDKPVPPYAYIILAVALVGFVFGLYPLTKRLAGKAALIGNFYIPFIFIIIVASILLAIFSPVSPWPAIIVAIGYFLFLFSDGFLIYTAYVKDKKRRDFYIMVSYLLAEALIVIGLLTYSIINLC